MPEPKPGEPWAFITHKDGYWHGVAAANMPKASLGKFLGDAAASGSAIMTVYSRDEYNAALKSLKMWKERASK